MTALLPALAPIPPEVVTLADYEPLARQRVSPQAWAYLSGGAGDEITLRRNREAFDEIRLRSRILADLKGGSTRIELFGRTFASPILLAPVAYLKLAHSGGEMTALLGATATDTGFVLSTHSSVALEEVAAEAAPGRLWFQLYPQPDRRFTQRLAERAQDAGYSALVVTLDAPVNGARDRERRAQFRLPPGVHAENMRGLESLPTYQGGRGGPLCGGILEEALTWKDIAWLKSLTRLPLILKGVMCEADALQAVELGVDGLVVSNHGGRTLDTMPAAIEVLPEVIQAVSGRVPVLLDGGVRRGTDVLKALALGASAVLVGRPYVFGLAAAGASGVAHVVNILRAELEVAMALTGCREIKAIDRSVIWKPRP